MTWVLTTILCIILVETMARLPFGAAISQIVWISRKATRTLGAKFVSDHWKEKVLLAYAVSLFLATIKLAGYLFIVGAIAFVLIFISDKYGAMVSDFLSHWPGILYSMIVASVYFAARKYHA